MLVSPCEFIHFVLGFYCRYQGLQQPLHLTNGTSPWNNPLKLAERGVDTLYAPYLLNCRVPLFTIYCLMLPL